MDRTNRRYCGGQRPKRGAIASESNYFRMQFHSNEIFDGTGFYARYQFLNERTLLKLIEHRIVVIISLSDTSQNNRLKWNTFSGSASTIRRQNVVTLEYILPISIVLLTFLRTQFI